jgi:hypothetical protein
MVREMPYELHPPVNLMRSNDLAGTDLMNDILEMWSLPWHALQRRLAKGLAIDTAAAGTTRASGATAPIAPAGNWLMRARSAAIEATRDRG